MWDVKLESFVKPLDLNLDWCVAIEITLGAKKCVIFNLYMPYQCNDNNLYRNYTDKCLCLFYYAEIF